MIYGRRLPARTLLFASAVLGMTVLAAVPAHADRISDAWAQARDKWNAVGDTAAEGDAAALTRLEQEVARCQAAPDCAAVGDILPNPDRAATPQRIAAASAAANLGWLHRHGHVPDADPGKELAYYSIATELGHPIALYVMGDIYRDGTLVEADPLVAQTFFLLAEQEGMASAAVALGNMLSDEDPEAAISHYLEALRLRPTDTQRERAESRLDELIPSDEPPRQRPSYRERMTAYEACIPLFDEISETGRQLDEDWERMYDWEAELEELAESVVKPAEAAAYDADVRRFNAAADDIELRTDAYNTLTDEYNARCAFTVTQSEYRAFCRGEAEQSGWCQSFTPN